jgi:hypothetical protein
VPRFLGLGAWHTPAHRLVNGDDLPLAEPAARRFAESSHERAPDYAAAANHGPAGRHLTADRLAELSSIIAPTAQGVNVLGDGR